MAVITCDYDGTGLNGFSGTALLCVIFWATLHCYLVVSDARDVINGGREDHADLRNLLSTLWHAFMTLSLVPFTGTFPGFVIMFILLMACGVYVHRQVCREVERDQANAMIPNQTSAHVPPTPTIARPPFHPANPDPKEVVSIDDCPV